MTMPDWHAWHDTYDDPTSWQARRLATVRGWIRRVLDEAPPGPLTVLDMVAGQGRDLLPELAAHPRRHEVTARLVELDARNADLARAAALHAGLSTVEVVTGDAASTDHYRDLAPADLVLICGLFPHISDEDIANVVAHSAALTKRGGVLIWTRHRRAPDLVPRISAWLGEQGFAEVWVTDPEIEHAVAVHRYLGEPRPLPAGTTMFTFVGIRNLRPWEFPAHS
jgi:methyltransferase family protein